MPRAPTITDQQRAAVLAVVEARRLLPTDKQLARRTGLSIRSVRMIRQQARDTLLSNVTVSRETIAGTIACDGHRPNRIHRASR